MRINTNIASMNAQTNAAQTNKNITSSLEKLSSGLRINKAADDASGMAIADKLRTQASSLGQGIANANSGSALIQIADKALGEQSNILDTVKTKLIQAATSTTSSEGREAIRKDITKLLGQLDDISATTNYNGINLLNEKGATFNFQVGETSDVDVEVTTAYAVNTSGLGASNEIPVDADATLAYAAAGSVAIKEDDTDLTVQNNTTVAGANKAILIGGDVINTVGATSTSFTVSATNVESIELRNTLNAAVQSVTLETADDALIDTLNSIAEIDGHLTKNADGNYTLTQTAATTLSAIDFGGAKLDITDLKVTGLTVGSLASTSSAIAIETDDEVTVTKIGGADKLSIDSGTVTTNHTAAATFTATLVGKGSSNADGIAYGGTAGDAVKIDTGTASIKVDQSDGIVDKANIGINTIVNTAGTADGSFTVNADQVEKISLVMTGGTGSVVLSTNDTATMSKLDELAKYTNSLTKVDEDMYSFSQTAANTTAVLDFGSEKVDVASLTFSGVNNGSVAATTESIYIQTDEGVSVTKNGYADDQDISLAAFDGVGTAATANTAVGVTTDAASVSGSLAGLKGLEEDELTADVANSFMANIDEAINQINAVRADFGSTQNQLEVATRSMMVTQVNISAAESVIRDTDYAAESANFNKQNIIAQAGTYAMSQANALAQNVQRLLQ
jgi:flagellin